MQLTFEQPSGSRKHEVIAGLLIAFVGGFSLYKGAHGLVFGPESPADASADPTLDLAGILLGPWLLLLGGRLISGGKPGQTLLGPKQLFIFGVGGVLGAPIAAWVYHVPTMLMAVPIGAAGIGLWWYRRRRLLDGSRLPDA